MRWKLYKCKIAGSLWHQEITVLLPGCVILLRDRIETGKKRNMEKWTGSEDGIKHN